MLWRNKNLPAAVWQDFVRRHPVSPSVVGQVLEVHPFGAFVELTGGVIGILHCSLWLREPEPGQHISVRVSSVDEQRRISLAPA